MAVRPEERFIDLPRDQLDNHYFYYQEYINPRARDKWVRPFRTEPRLRGQKRGKMRKVRDFFEKFTLANLGAMLKWAWSWLKFRFKRPHKFVTYSAPASARPGLIQMSNQARILLASDWGTATEDAVAVGQAMAALTPRPEVTIHLGDVYYTGETAEYRDYFFPYWPEGTHPEHPVLLLNANHEMYSGGDGYFEYALKRVGQEASYFCLENDHWRIIGLDTGYHSIKSEKGSVDKQDARKLKLPEALVKWLDEVVFTDPSDPRAVILLSHHQWFCAFGSEYYRPAQQLRPFVQKPALWFWGHEHVFAVYDFVRDVINSEGQRFEGIPVYARCIGHGGMPLQIARLNEKKAEREREGRRRPLLIWDQRQNRRVQDTEVGFCGFADLQFELDQLVVSYRDQTGRVLLKEAWRQTRDGLEGTVLQLDAGLTVLDSGQVYRVPQNQVVA